eukprot:maker-scaffold_66-snap-gene-0.75-mRNA-1 protein AED:0.85 eAED:0.85 QI:0/0/0/0.5/1/1/2/0/544
MLLAPYAPIGFLPNPATSLVYRMDKGKLELDKLMKLVKDDEGELKFLCRWRGFSENDDTFEPALTIFEDLPHLVTEFCRDNISLETIQLTDFLMTVYPDSEYLGQIETQRKIFAMNENEVSSFEEKLVFGKILIDEKENWNRLKWSTFELQPLRVGLLSRGFGNFEELKLFIPGKSKQQIYTKIQRTMELFALRQDNSRWRSEDYFVQKKPLSEGMKLLRKYLFKWKYVRKSVENQQEYEFLFIEVYNLTYSEGVKAMMDGMISNKNKKWRGFPRITGTQEEALLYLKGLWSKLKKREKEVEKELYKAEDLLLKKIVMPSKKADLIFTEGETNNLVKVESEKTNFIAFLWRIPEGSYFYAGKVEEFLDSHNEKYEVIVVDPPWHTFSADPVRGPAVNYNVMKDFDIINLSLKRIMDKTTIFIWVIRGKEHVVEQLFEVNGFKKLGRLVWIKTNGKDKIVSTLGNVTMKCTEECIIGVYNSFPRTLIQRNFGKEVFYGKRSGNAQKPTEFYRLIESNFESDTAKLELFGRKNNLRNGWLVVGGEL